MTNSTQTKIVLYFLAILLGSWSADAAEVALRPQSRARGSLVLLGDVANVTSSDTQLTARLNRVELFPAPATQRSKLMHVRELVELLVLHGIAIDDVQFTGSRTTRIYGPSPTSAVVAAGLNAPTTSPAATVNAAEMVVVTRRTLNRGDVIREADIELREADPKAPRFQVATQRQGVVGMELLVPLREGQTISLAQIRKPLLVRRGEVIRVRARASGVQVTTTARATQDGARGDIITVQSLENQEKYSAYVTALQQAEVYATGVVAADPAPAAARRAELLTEAQP